MTLHDAAMTRFGQWWRRAMRGGYAYALGAHLHGAPPERHYILQSRRAQVWGIYIPIVCLLVGAIFGPWGWLAFLVYPLNILRKMSALRGSLRERAMLAWFFTIVHFPESLGQIKFLADRMFGRQSRLIEYK